VQETKKVMGLKHLERETIDTPAKSGFGRVSAAVCPREKGGKVDDGRATALDREKKEGDLKSFSE